MIGENLAKSVKSIHRYLTFGLIEIKTQGGHDEDHHAGGGEGGVPRAGEESQDPRSDGVIPWSARGVFCHACRPLPLVSNFSSPPPSSLLHPRGLESVGNDDVKQTTRSVSYATRLAFFFFGGDHDGWRHAGLLAELDRIVRGERGPQFHAMEMVVLGSVHMVRRP